MMELATTIAFCLLGFAVLAAVIRVVIGPTLADRVLALDTITVLGIGLIAVFALRTGLFLYTDLAVALGLLGFLSTAAFARYLISRSRP